MVRLYTKSFNSIKSSKHISKVLSNGHVFKFRFLTIFIADRTDKPSIAFIAGKKLGGAVIRNKLKRKLREIFLNQCEALDDQYDYIFMARLNLLNYDSKVIVSELKKEFNQERYLFFE